MNCIFTKLLFSSKTSLKHPFKYRFGRFRFLGDGQDVDVTVLVVALS